jgi:hypothetical protein
MQKYSSLVLAIVVTVLAVVAKLKFVPLADNFALFGALSLFCGAYLRGWAAWCLPIGGMIVSDFLGTALRIPGVYLYDYRAMLFNYVGFAAMIGIGSMLRRNAAIERTVIAVLSGSIAYFLISNFGSWLDPQLKYDRSLSGLVQCYTMALPFYRTTFQADVFFSAVLFGTQWWAMSHQRQDVAERTKA